MNTAVRRLLLLATLALVPLGVLAQQSWDILGGRALASRADLQARLAGRALSALLGLDRATAEAIVQATGPLDGKAPIGERLAAISQGRLVVAGVAFNGDAGAGAWAYKGRNVADSEVPDGIRDPLVLARRRPAAGTFVVQGGARPLLLVSRDLGPGARAALAIDGEALMARVGQPLLDKAGLGADARFEIYDPEASSALLLVSPEQLPAEWKFAAVGLTHRSADRLASGANRSLWTARAGFGLLLLWIAGALVGMTRLAAREVELARMKFDFVSAVSHELQAPLGTVRLYSDLLLLGRVAPGKDPKDYLRHISMETHRLIRLVQNILTYSVARRGRKAFDLQQVDLRDIAAEAVDTLAPEAETRGIATALDSAGPALALGDRDAARQAILNLVSNAIKYGRSSAEITIRNRGETIAVAVSDDGPGIPPDESKRVFQPFYRIGREATRTSPGTGLGLAIVREIMQAHRGSVQLESRPGEGATFILCFPAARGHHGMQHDAHDFDRRG